MTLVIMAAGMGSRFGGLKQIEPVGPNGEFIIDYSIYDALCAGFTKVVFIIKKENYEVFKETIGSRIEGKVNVEYVFQSNDNLPSEIKVPETREKPFGTGHALYSAIEKIEGPFAVISADDFYGKEPFFLLRDSLNRNEFSVIGYQIGNTLATHGSVKRGVCFEKNGALEYILESKVERKNGVIVGEPLNGSASYEMEENHPVSMLMYGMQDKILDFIKKDVFKFFEENKGNLESCEYLLPDVLNDYARATNTELKLIPTTSIWKGVTYREDLEDIKSYIKGLIDKGEYPSNLY